MHRIICHFDSLPQCLPAPPGSLSCCLLFYRLSFQGNSRAQKCRASESEGLTLGSWIWKSQKYFGKDETHPSWGSQQKPSCKLKNEHGGTWMLDSLCRFTRKWLLWDNALSPQAEQWCLQSHVEQARKDPLVHLIFTQPLSKLLSSRPNVPVSFYICRAAWGSITV